ncbi:D-alanyl-lipoteichoic acid biosynthesis protein DltB [Eggerthellaceae bacterium zg-1084]|uniref:D-alanyl-lipoteichoic acid biosynthesis protein DltB n=1 Tax=Berryella wangjianweii TaxID=2734634 RepID=UPI0015548A91|nr:D-alanyl-lipoteichoic acid biosynthesis protein DltB [Berryella wangjianweii]NPD30738.1 D-alanyl-lipoteichoic acid biosynthesis protein DltB [Berryella wangjianweii]
MSFYVDPSFFVLLALVAAGAAFLGLRERPLGAYGAVASVAMVACLFSRTPLQGGLAAGYLALSCAAVQLIQRNPSSNKRFALSLTMAIAPLVISKVSAAFDNHLVGFIGISYLTFKTIQMVIESRDGIIKQLGVRDTFMFLAFFPTFTSGPIDRSTRFLEDAHRVRPRDEYAGMLARGILLLCAGLAYKLVIASLLFSHYSPHPWGSDPAWIELARQVRDAYAYGLYLFFDFAGYSLMAMGASRMLGIDTPRNFRAPFLAIDIKDFWNRWHITLSQWLRDFVFMRLARFLMRRKVMKTRLRTSQCAYLANMTLMGAWHGLTPAYLLYGLYHGGLLAGTEAMQRKWAFYRTHHDRLWFKAASWFLTLQLTMFGFALFSGQFFVMMKGILP